MIFQRGKIFQSIEVFRVKFWWNHIIPPILSVSYFLLNYLHKNFQHSVFFIVLVLFSSVFSALFGFFLNDVTDIKQDEAAGKKNTASSIPKNLRVILLIIFSLFGIIPWIFITKNLVSYILIIIQYLLLIFYSVEPIRAKRNLYLSVVFDSLYSGLVFILAVLFAFDFTSFNLSYGSLLLVVVILSLLLRGFRNILYHLTEDIENDTRSGIQTLATKYGNEKIKNILKHYMLPVEIILLHIFSLLLSFSLPYFFISIIVFDFYLLYILLRKRFQMYLAVNDFYEHILPVVFLIYLSIQDYWFLIVLILHLVLFPKLFINILNPFLKWIFYKIFVHMLYHGIIVWLYYKIFCNKYAKRFYKFLSLK